MSLYTVTMANQTVIADSEMIIIRAATAYSSRASVLQIHRLWCGQAGTATSQQLAVRWGLKASAFGTMTSTTPAPVRVGTVASAITGSTTNAASSCGTDSSSNGAGTLTVMGQDGFNNLNGWLYLPTPEERIIVGPDLSFCFQLQGTPTTLTNWSAVLEFEEGLLLMATAKFKTREGSTVLDGDRGTFTLAYGSYTEEHERLSGGKNKAGEPVVVEVVGEVHTIEHVERVYDEEGIAVGKTSETRWEILTDDAQYPAVGVLPENVISKT